MDTQQLKLSYEFFPPRTDAGMLNLEKTCNDLSTLNPEFYSVTYGAGGSTREKTLETVKHIQQQTHIDACPHLTCVGSTNQEIIDLLDIYQELNVSRLVVLRGDPPGGMVGMGECEHASDMVSIIKEKYNDQFSIAVAAYPEAHPDSRDIQTEVDFFAHKMNAGADLAITQYFYNADSYFHFLDLCLAKNISQPIVPGIMPIANFTSLRKFSKQCGTEIPRWLKKSMMAYDNDPQSQRQLGLEIVTNMVDRLTHHGVKNLHFYTMNQSALTQAILKNLSSN